MARKNSRIAQERIEYLYSVAQRWFKEERFDDSRTAIKHLRAVATKHTLPITAYKKTFCKHCNTLLVAGVTSRVRIHNNQQVQTCAHCENIKRRGF